MSSTELRVTCPHCGAPTAATMTPSPENGRLTGSVESCLDCESAFELYYY
ncbi:hypothetical protein [Halalkalicoccus jeotgali]|nr:hypothetical protein [Halalkalicoccus jeotgali]